MPPCSAEMAPISLSGRCRAWMAALHGSRGRVALPPLDRVTLVVVDAQRLFCDPASPAYLPSWEACAPQVWSLADRFIQTARPLVFTQHVHRPNETGNSIEHFFGRLLMEGDPLADLLPEAAARVPPAVLHPKCRHAAFADARPDSLGAAQFVALAGVQTHLCILATAVDLARYGLIPIVVANACAAREEASHLAALRVLAAGHAYIASTGELLAALGREETP